ncbi:MAG: hypothetical protein WBD40_18545, partial [Tepidisphaeraceae bacterium]
MFSPRRVIVSAAMTVIAVAGCTSNSSSSRKSLQPRSPVPTTQPATPPVKTAAMYTLDELPPRLVLP